MKSLGQSRRADGGVDPGSGSAEVSPSRYTIWWLRDRQHGAATISVVLPVRASNRVPRSRWLRDRLGGATAESLRAGERVLIRSQWSRHRGGPNSQQPRPGCTAPHHPKNIRSWPSSVWTARSTTAGTAGAGIGPYDVLDALGGTSCGGPTLCCARVEGWLATGFEQHGEKRSVAGWRPTRCQCCAALT